MTDLQLLYDRFQTKVDEDLTDKESLIFSLVDVAIAKSYKNTKHKLDYVLTDPEEYEGYFIDDLSKDEIELLALWMLYEWNRREQQKLRGQRADIGTSDFNRLPNKKEQLQSVTLIMKDIKEEIDDLKNDMNTYEN